MAGSPASEIVAAAVRDQSQMIVMGTQGHGPIGRALMGSIAQRVIADSDLPALPALPVK